MVFSGKSNYLFDLDGTLVDSSPLHERAFRMVLGERCPAALSAFDYELAKGRTTRDVFVEVAPGDSAWIERLTAEKQHTYRSLLERGGLRVLAGGRELLEFLISIRRTLYLVTSGSSKSVEQVVAATRIGRYFTGVVTSNDVAAGKPEPAIYLKCLERYGLKPSECVSVEDAECGVRASVAAGIDCLLVGKARPAHSGALAIFSTLGDLHSAIARTADDVHVC